MRLFILILPVFLLLGMTSARAAELGVYVEGMRLEMPVESYKERLFRSVVKQEYDFSCGSAALATLLHYHYDWPVEEDAVLRSMYAVGDQEKIRREGFSLLDMKKYLGSLGLQAAGYRASLERLNEVGIPAIALINQDGYLHFVVIKGVNKQMVLVGDPSRGLRVVDRAAFQKMWNGIIFVILNDKEIAQASFNREQDWYIRQSAKLAFEAALSDQDLATFTIYTTPTPNYYF